MTQPLSWIDLPAVKVHLNIDAAVTKDDAELATFIARAESMLFNRVGHVKRLTAPVVEYREGGRSRVWLDDAPVGEVDAVTVAGVVVAEADRDVAAPDGWYLEDEHQQRAGVIKHTTRFPDGWVKVTHRPGRDPVPADLELAALEMVRELWDDSQRGGTTSHPGLRNRAGNQPDEDDDEGELLPPRVAALIAPYELPERAR